jgi:hypothetical protein
LRPDVQRRVDWRRSLESGASSDGDVVALGLPKLNQSDGNESAEEGEGTGPERRWGYRWLDEFDGFAWQLLRTPADDFVHLTVFPNGEKNERGEEE